MFSVCSFIWHVFLKLFLKLYHLAVTILGHWIKTNQWTKTKSLLCGAYIFMGIPVVNQRGNDWVCQVSAMEQGRRVRSVGRGVQGQDRGDLTERGKHKMRRSGERFQAQVGLQGAKPWGRGLRGVSKNSGVTGEEGGLGDALRGSWEGVRFCRAPKAILRTLCLTWSAMGGQPMM